MGLYIQTHSMHGLFRSQNIELGRDEDTGGQIVYVLNLAKALGKLKGVDKVDIITRRFTDPDYPGYSEAIEPVSDKVSIVRIACGPKKYLKKVDLWPHLPEFIRNVKKYNQSIKRRPDILHSNYADSGLVCATLSEDLGIPQVHTGHSLGIPKMRKLGVTKTNRKKFRHFHFEKRVAAEQKTIDNSTRIVTSTREEQRNQYSGYRIGKTTAEKFRVIPPGIDIDTFHPIRKEDKKSEAYGLMKNIFDQGFKHPDRPPIMALSRLDKRKNVVGLIQAYAADEKLQSMANLVIFAPTLEGGKEEQRLIKRINRIIRQFNLYDNIALPAVSLDYETEVPVAYRFCAARGGVFVNPALIEPFGLTLLEAMASGLPVVATKHGGPSELITDGLNGMLIDPRSSKDIVKQIKKLLRHPQLWKDVAKDARIYIRRRFTWRAAARSYLRIFKDVLKETH